MMRAHTITRIVERISSIWINTVISPAQYYDGFKMHCWCAVFLCAFIIFVDRRWLCVCLPFFGRVRFICLVSFPFPSFAISHTLLLPVHAVSWLCCSVHLAWAKVVRASKPKTVKILVVTKIYAIFPIFLRSRICFYLSEESDGPQVVFNLSLNCTPHLARFSCPDAWQRMCDVHVLYWYSVARLRSKNEPWASAAARLLFSILDKHTRSPFVIRLFFSIFETFD